MATPLIVRKVGGGTGFRQKIMDSHLYVFSRASVQE